MIWWKHCFKIKEVFLILPYFNFFNEKNVGSISAKAFENTGWGKSSFTIVNTQTFILMLLFLIIVLFSIQTTVNLLLPHPVYYLQSLETLSD